MYFRSVSDGFRTTVAVGERAKVGTADAVASGLAVPANPVGVTDAERVGAAGTVGLVVLTAVGVAVVGGNVGADVTPQPTKPVSANTKTPIQNGRVPIFILPHNISLSIRMYQLGGLFHTAHSTLSYSDAL